MLLSFGSVEPSDFLTISRLVLLEGPLGAGNAKTLAAAFVDACRVEQGALSNTARQTSGLRNDEGV